MSDLPLYVRTLPLKMPENEANEPEHCMHIASSYCHVSELMGRPGRPGNANIEDLNVEASRDEQ